MSFAVVSAHDPEGRARWLTAWMESSEREVAAHPDYARLFAGPGREAVCAIWRTTQSSIIFPMILRPIDSESWGGGSVAVDFESPYGYGGPFASGQAPAEQEQFWDAFDGWARNTNLASGFARLSLFPEQLCALRGEVREVQENVICSLELDDEELLRSYEHKVRKNINTARRANLRVEFDEEGERLAEFCEIYASTMERREAKAHYRFPTSFFQDITERLPGNFVFAHVLEDSTLISTELILLSRKTMYSFLGGTREERFQVRPNDLLKHEAIRWGRATGRKHFVLGGGYGGQDGIFRYKRAFAPNGVRPFSVFQRVWSQELYDDLVTRRTTWESQRGFRWAARADFFPGYRS